MKKAIIALTFVGLTAASYFIFRSKTIDIEGLGPESETVPLKVAEYAAKERLSKLFEESKWENLGYNIYYDLEGKPKAYAFVFKKPNFEYRNLESLEKKIQTMEQITSSGKRSRYFPEDTATVVTYAQNTDKIISRHYRGLPDILVEKSKIKEKIENQYLNTNLELGRCIFTNDLDIYYEVKSVGLDFEDQPVADSSYLL